MNIFQEWITWPDSLIELSEKHEEIYVEKEFYFAKEKATWVLDTYYKVTDYEPHGLNGRIAVTTVPRTLYNSQSFSELQVCDFPDVFTQIAIDQFWKLFGWMREGIKLFDGGDSTMPIIPVICMSLGVYEKGREPWLSVWMNAGNYPIRWEMVCPSYVRADEKNAGFTSLLFAVEKAYQNQKDPVKLQAEIGKLVEKMDVIRRRIYY